MPTHAIARPPTPLEDGVASVPTEPRTVLGRVDRAGRLIAADPELEALQRDAGARLGDGLALPQVAAVARLALKLNISVERPALAASNERDYNLWVRAVPEGDEIALIIEGWEGRPAAAPRLISLASTVQDGHKVPGVSSWSADSELRFTAISPQFAAQSGVNPEEAQGLSLTRLLRLVEDEGGDLPLVSALAARRAFSGQQAVSRNDPTLKLILSGEPILDESGAFAGFQGSATGEGSAPRAAADEPDPMDDILDEVLRAPLDRIISSAEEIVQRADGPLRSDYASYGTDIAAAARHLLSVIQSMGDEGADDHELIDLGALAAEAVVLVEATAEQRGIAIAIDAAGKLPARGEERAVIQILVNLIGNAVRHSPESGTVRLTFSPGDMLSSVTVSDEGPGIALTDQQRIFERFEKISDEAGGTGLGLAISRRLARSMDGDITLDSAPGTGSRFTLTLPGA